MKSCITLVSRGCLEHGVWISQAYFCSVKANASFRWLSLIISQSGSRSIP